MEGGFIKLKINFNKVARLYLLIVKWDAEKL